MKQNNFEIIILCRISFTGKEKEEIMFSECITSHHRREKREEKCLSLHKHARIDGAWVIKKKSLHFHHIALPNVHFHSSLCFFSSISVYISCYMFFAFLSGRETSSVSVLFALLSHYVMTTLYRIMWPEASLPFYILYTCWYIQLPACPQLTSSPVSGVCVALVKSNAHSRMEGVRAGRVPDFETYAYT